MIHLKWSIKGRLITHVRYIKIDLIHDARHLCTRIRADELKAMSRGLSGGKREMKPANTRNRGCVINIFLS